MELDLSLYAVQRLADGTWVVRTQMGDPLWPAVDVVAAVGVPTSGAPRELALTPAAFAGVGAAPHAVTGSSKTG